MLGVERYALSRWEGLGDVARFAKGLCRLDGSLSTRGEDVLPACLSIDPGRRCVAVVVSAGCLDCTGGVSPSLYEFCTPERKQTKPPHLVHKGSPPRPVGCGDRLGHTGVEALALGGGPA